MLERFILVSSSCDGLLSKSNVSVINDVVSKITESDEITLSSQVVCNGFVLSVFSIKMNTDEISTSSVKAIKYGLSKSYIYMKKSIKSAIDIVSPFTLEGDDLLHFCMFKMSTSPVESLYTYYIVSNDEGEVYLPLDSEVSKQNALYMLDNVSKSLNIKDLINFLRPALY